MLIVLKIEYQIVPIEDSVVPRSLILWYTVYWMLLEAPGWKLALLVKDLS